MDHSTDGYHDLATAVIRCAVKDLLRGKPCDGACRDGAHECADDARAFLEGEGAAFWLDAVEADQGTFLEALAQSRA